MIIMLKLGQLVRSSFIWHYCWGLSSVLLLLASAAVQN